MTKEEAIQKLDDLHPLLPNEFRYQEYLLRQFKTYIGQFRTIFLWGEGMTGEWR